MRIYDNFCLVPHYLETLGLSVKTPISGAVSALPLGGEVNPTLTIWGCWAGCISVILVYLWVIRKVREVLGRTAVLSRKACHNV